MEATAAKIANIDMSIVRRRGHGHAILKMLREFDLAHFAGAYDSLGTLLARVRNSTGAAPVAYRTPPGQTTVPQNPNLTAGSNASTSTSSSMESKGEPYVNKFAIHFLDTVFLSVSEWVQQLKWANPKAQAFLFSQYVPLTQI